MLRWLEFSPLALWVKGAWGWPFALVIHDFGSAMLIGFGLFFCLRLSGLLSTIPALSVARLIPFVWVGIGLQVFSGFLLWLTKPGRYLNESTFDFKLVLVVAGCLAVRYVQRTVSQRGGDGVLSEKFSRSSFRLAFALMALVWITGVTVIPRFIWSCPYSPPCGFYPPLSVLIWTVALVLMVSCIALGLVVHLDRQGNRQSTGSKNLP